MNGKSNSILQNTNTAVESPYFLLSSFISHLTKKH